MECSKITIKRFCTLGKVNCALVCCLAQLRSTSFPLQASSGSQIINIGMGHDTDLGLGDSLGISDNLLDAYGGRPNRRRQMQRQLTLILHAVRCRKEFHPFAGCNVRPNCVLMKSTLNHLEGCAKGESCPVPRCRSTSALLDHWNTCDLVFCAICMEVREPMVPQPNN